MFDSPELFRRHRSERYEGESETEHLLRIADAARGRAERVELAMKEGRLPSERILLFEYLKSTDAPQ